MATATLAREAGAAVSHVPVAPSRLLRDPDRLRVTFYLDSTQRGGAAFFLVSLLDAVSERITPSIIVNDPAMARLFCRFRPRLFIDVTPPVRGRGDALRILQHRAAIARSSPDVVHVNARHLFSAQYGVLAAASAGVPSVLVVHSVFPSVSPSQELLTRLVARLPRHVVAVSQFVADAITKELRVARSRLSVVRNGVADLACRVAPDSQDDLLLFVGRLAPEKGVDVLLHAMTLLPNAQLVIAGDGAQRSELESLRDRLQLSDRVRFAGWVGSWTQRFRPALLVAPSRVEAAPLSVIEAMGAGIPVVASAVGGLPEMVESGATGLLVPVGDPQALAGAVGSLLGDGSRRLEMGRLARERYTARYTLGDMARRYEDLYWSVARIAGGR